MKMMPPATEEIRVGDNDNLSALVANLLEADLLVILTDQPGVYTADPRRDQNASLIRQLDRVDEATMAIAGGAGTSGGTGGMATKLQAAAACQPQWRAQRDRRRARTGCAATHSGGRINRHASRSRDRSHRKSQALVADRQAAWHPPH